MLCFLPSRQGRPGVSQLVEVPWSPELPEVPSCHKGMEHSARTRPMLASCKNLAKSSFTRRSYVAWH